MKQVCFLGEWGRWASMGGTAMGKESPLAELPYSLKSPSSECGFSQPPLQALGSLLSPGQWHPQGELVPVLS